jgi:hypothetical protein
MEHARAAEAAMVSEKTTVAAMDSTHLLAFFTVTLLLRWVFLPEEDWAAPSLFVD